MRVFVTRPAGSGGRAARTAGGARSSGPALPADRDRAARRRPVDVSRLRLGGRHEPERCPRAAAANGRHPAPRWLRSGRRPPTRSAAPTCAGGVDPGRAARRAAATRGSRAVRRRAEGARHPARRRARSRRRRRSTGRSSTRADAALEPTSSCSRRRRRAPRVWGAATPPGGVDRAGDDACGHDRWARRSQRKPGPTT